MSLDFDMDRVVAITRDITSKVDPDNWGFAPNGNSFEHDVSLDFTFYAGSGDPYFGVNMDMITGKIDRVTLYLPDEEDLKKDPESSVPIDLAGLSVTGQARPEVIEIFEEIRRKIQGSRSAA